MTRIDRFVGIDVCKARLDVHCHPDGESFAVANSAAGIARLVGRLGPGRWIAGCEATGGHEDRLVVALNEAGRDIWCLHPAEVRAFARLTGTRAKTDRLDARLIGRALAAASASRKPLRRTAMQSQLKELTALRRHLIATITELKSFAARATGEHATALLARRMAAAESDLAGLRRTIARLIASDADCHRQAGLIRSVPGAGPVLAAEIVAAMPELATMTAKQAASLAGVAPHPRQSGNGRQNGRCQGGRAALRRCLYMAALSAIKATTPDLYPFYLRLRQAGKPFKVAIVAVMRKLLCQIAAVLRRNTPFEPGQQPSQSTVA